MTTFVSTMASTGKKIAVALAVVSALAVVVGGYLSMGKVKEPSFATTTKDGDFELRRYGPRVVAETELVGEWGDAGNEGFRRLAGYIFGKNTGRKEIAMTAPVAQRREAKGAPIPMTAPVGQRRDGGAWIVSFTMPEGETLATLPAPEDPRVVLRELPPIEVAVVRFSGRWTDANMAARTQALQSWVRARGLTVRGEPEVNRYDPPFKPWFLRRNEVWFEVVARDAGM